MLHTSSEPGAAAGVEAEFAPRAEFGAETRELAVGAAGVPLTIHHPSGACKGSAVLVPGWSGPRSGPAELLVFLAAQLARKGYRAVRLDLPGRGDAGGDFHACDLDGMIGAVVQTAREFQQEGRCLLLGMCSGGNAALGAAPLLQRASPCVEARVVALSTLPFQPARAKSFERRRRWKNFKQYAGKALAPATWLRLARGEVNLRRVKKNMTAAEKPSAGGRNPKDSARDVERELLEWKQPALFIWGGGDEEAALARAHFEKLHGLGLGAPGETQFHTIGGANHNFYARAWRLELAEKVLAFGGGR